MKRVKEKIQFKLLTLCLLSLGEGIKGRGLFLFLLFFFSLPFGEGWGGASSFAQNYPIQITTQLVQPFSGFIPDYSTPGNQNLKLLVVFTDFTKPSYNIKLKLQITGQGITIQSKSYYYSGPITLQPGTPIEISGSDLSGLFNSANLDFSGITPQKYQTNSLPEGYYNICFTAYDYNNPIPIQVSNQNCAFGWMVLSDPPYLNLPICGSTTTVNTPQNMMFQWTAMNMNSPNSANTTLYDFDLYEVRPSTQSPGNIIQTLPPIYQVTTPFTFVNYGITEPQLYYGMQYVWRVRAREQSNRDLFKNQGSSQLCTFTYGSVLSQIDSNSIKLTLQGTALTYRLAKYTWDSLSIFLSYKLEYRKQGSPNWFPINTTTCKSIVNNLEPENTYEARVKGIFSEGDGPWSNIVTITTPAKPVIVCGQGGIPPLASNFIPLKTGKIAQVWNIGQFDMLITQLDNPNSPNGKYSGYGKIAIPFLANMNLNGKFSNITVNEAMEVVEGKVEITTSGVDEWVNQGELNQNDFTYNGTVDSVIVNNNGTITIFGTNGQSIQTPIDYPYVVTDANGNTWEVYGNGSVAQSHNAQYEDIVCVKDSSVKYYLKTDSDTAKYFENTAIFRLKSTDNITLKFFNTDNITLNNDSIYWKIDGKKKCPKNIQCTWSLSKPNDYKIVFYKNSKPIFKCKLIVYDSPLIIFKKGDNYNGEYGFDDGYKYSQIANDYPILDLPFNNSFKSVPYLSLKPNQQVTLKLNPTALKTKAITDNDFRIHFGSTSSLVTINGLDTQNISLLSLVNNPVIAILSNKLEDAPSEKVEYVFALNSKNDTIGKIAISCYDNPKIRKLALVYVKHKTNEGYRTDVTKQDVVNYLNNNSHNQLHVKWNIAPTDTNYIDTLNISTEYATHWQNFQASSLYALNTMYGLYCQKYGLSLNHAFNYFFITNISLTNEDGFSVGGKNGFKSNYGILFNSILSYNEAIAHELGHALDLRHTFTPLVVSRLIQQGTTKNFMDYINSGRDTWFRYQYNDALPQIK